MKYSIIVAVYNRPDEVAELLESLAAQTLGDFEVVVVEDGSSVPCKDVCDSWAHALAIRYHQKPNSGPGLSRNYGCRRAVGDYFIFLDSDCMAPPGYLAAIDSALAAFGYDAFGGPDREHPSFSVTQKAISHAMTSLLTTGGIRGGTVRTGGIFHPRSFNMGISQKVFHTTDGFGRMRFGEDVDFSMRIIEAGFSTGLVPDAWVYHKRRTDLWKFFKQVHNSGIARINLSFLHPGTLKLTHFFPAAFTAYLAVALLYTIILPQGVYSFAPVLLYLGLVALEGAVRTRSLAVGAMSIAATLVQHCAYGTGFMKGVIRQAILGRPAEHSFEKTLYD
jgi:glycosyltransferase involved in cell wall biosynthesis